MNYEVAVKIGLPFMGRARRRRILVVDDDATVGALVSARLNKVENYEVIVTYSAKAAVPTAQGKQPDVILLDWEFPDGNGYNVLCELKRGPKTKQIPVFMLTGRHRMADVERALSVGASGYFTKPPDLPQIARRLKIALEQGDSGPP